VIVGKIELNALFRGNDLPKQRSEDQPGSVNFFNNWEGITDKAKKKKNGGGNTKKKKKRKNKENRGSTRVQGYNTTTRSSG